MRTLHTLILASFLAISPALAQPRPDKKANKHARLEQLAARKGLKVLTIPIEGAMGDAMTALIIRSAREARSWKADVVLLDINTPGGDLLATQLMCAEMTRLAEDGVLTVAYVRHTAWSAGALLSLSCQFIVMRGSASIGSAKPFIMGQKEKPSAAMEEKLNSAVRADFRSMAQRMGHPPTLAMAMVDQQLQVYQVQVDGKKRYLTSDQIEELADAKEVKQGAVVCRKGQLLNLTSKEAMRYGLASEIAESPAALFQLWGLQIKETRKIKPTWSEGLAGWLSSGMIVMLLLVLGGLGIYTEITSPGFGFPGIIGIVCIGLLLFGKHLAGLAEVADIALIMIGLLLLAAEIFIIPGFGLAGISGLICVSLGLVLSLQSFVIPQNPLQSAQLQENVLLVLYSAGFVMIGMFLMVRYLSLVPGFNKMIHSTAQTEEYVVGQPGLSELQGMQGTTSTKLRPSGKAEINGQQVDVVSKSEFIEMGTPIRVVSVNGPTVTVERT